MMDGAIGGVMGLMMLLFMLIAAGAVVVGLAGGARFIKVMRGRTEERPALQDREWRADQPSPVEQAKERYVRGEIYHAELDRQLDVLLKNDHRTGADR